MNLIPMSWRLKRLSRTAKPSREFALRLQSALREKGAFATSTPRLSSVRREWGGASWRLAMVAACFVLLFGVGTGAYAYTSDNVVPDHPLYPVRQGIETAEEAIAITPAWKEAVQRKHIARKIREIETVQARNPLLSGEPEGRALERIEAIMQKGLDDDLPVPEIRDRVLGEVLEAKRLIREEDLEAQERLNIMRRRFHGQLDVIQRRLEAMERRENRRETIREQLSPERERRIERPVGDDDESDGEGSERERR